MSPAAMRLLARSGMTAEERAGAPLSEERIDEIIRAAGITDIATRVNLKRELMGRGAGL